LRAGRRPAPVTERDSISGRARRQIADDNYAPVIGNELFEA
jgi:hypothetical protein